MNGTAARIKKLIGSGKKIVVLETLTGLAFVGRAEEDRTAEEQVIAIAQTAGVDLEGSTLYTPGWLPPAKSVVNITRAGIARLVSANPIYVDQAGYGGSDQPNDPIRTDFELIPGLKFQPENFEAAEFALRYAGVKMVYDSGLRKNPF